MKKKHYKMKYCIFRIIDVIVSLLPLLIYCSLNIDKYFGVRTTIISNIFGFVLLSFMLVLILLKKSQIFQGMLGLVMLELLVIFLDVYIQDLKFILGYSIAGLLISKLTTNLIAQKYKRLADKEETAQENANAMNQSFDRIVEELKGIGRA